MLSACCPGCPRRKSIFRFRLLYALQKSSSATQTRAAAYRAAAKRVPTSSMLYHSPSQVRCLLALRNTLSTSAYLPTTRAAPQAHACHQALEAFFSSSALAQLCHSRLNVLSGQCSLTEPYPHLLGLSLQAPGCVTHSGQAV